MNANGSNGVGNFRPTSPPDFEQYTATVDESFRCLLAENTHLRRALLKRGISIRDALELYRLGHVDGAHWHANREADLMESQS